MAYCQPMKMQKGGCPVLFIIVIELGLHNW